MLDGYNLRILETWQQRGEIGPVEMSQAVNLSASQCSRRMQQLRKAGYICGIHAALDSERLGIGITAYVLITMHSRERRESEKFFARISALDEVLECQTLTGTADLILKVATHNLASFNELLTSHLLSAPEVATARSSIILDNIKSTTALPTRFAGRGTSDD